MASWIDFLKDSNNDIVYPAGITSGVFLPNGKKLSSWMKEIEKSIECIGDYIIIDIHPNQWYYSKRNDGSYDADCFGILPDSFKDISTVEDPTNNVRKYIWVPYVDTEKYYNEIELVSNANKYIIGVDIGDIPYSVFFKASKRPPYKTCVKIINLSIPKISEVSKELPA